MINSFLYNYHSNLASIVYVLPVSFFLSHGGNIMKEWCKLLRDIKHNKDEFVKLIEYMNPLINKYVRLLYKDDFEDMREELILALWESVNKMNYCNNDGECFSYMSKSLKNKFLELYKKSKKLHDLQSMTAIEEIPDCPDLQTSSDFSDIIFREDIMRFLEHVNKRKKHIYFQILLNDKSDAEIAKSFNISRQYVNRIRKELYVNLRKYFNENPHII